MSRIREAGSKMVCVACVVVLSGCASRMSIASKADLGRRRASVGGEAAFGGQMLAAADTTGGEAVVSAPPFEADTPEAAPERAMIYNGLMHIIVENIEASIQQVKRIAAGLGGYLQERDVSSITIKIPVGRFEEALSQVAMLGEVTRREVKGVDVTEEMRDLAIRLANAEGVRVRLLALLEKSEKVEDTLRIEKELARITETIELLKGKIRYLENKAAYATLDIRLNSPVPQKHLGSEIPFEWVNEIAEELTMGSPRRYARAKWFGGKIRVELPESYVTYYQEDYLTRAMSADNVFIKIARFDNYEGGTETFWAKLIRRALGASRAIAVKEEKDVALRSKNNAKVLFGAKTVGQQKYGYAIAIATAERFVYTYEVWGPEAAFAGDRPKIEDSIATLAAR